MKRMKRTMNNSWFIVFYVTVKIFVYHPAGLKTGIGSPPVQPEMPKIKNENARLFVCWGFGRLLSKILTNQFTHTCIKVKFLYDYFVINPVLNYRKPPIRIIETGRI